MQSPTYRCIISWFVSCFLLDLTWKNKYWYRYTYLLSILNRTTNNDEKSNLCKRETSLQRRHSRQCAASFNVLPFGKDQYGFIYRPAPIVVDYASICDTIYIVLNMSIFNVTSLWYTISNNISYNKWSFFSVSSSQWPIRQ